MGVVDIFLPVCFVSIAVLRKETQNNAEQGQAVYAGAERSNNYRGSMKKHWQIRKAISQDAAGLASCMESAYAAYQERMGGIRLPPMDIDYFSEIET